MSNAVSTSSRGTNKTEIQKRDKLLKEKRQSYPITNSSNKIIFKEGKYYIINEDGNIISDSIEKLGLFKSGLAVFIDGLKKGVVNSDGKCVMSKLDNARVDEDIIHFESNGKWGFADCNGNIQCKTQYGFIENFVNGYARFRTLENFWGVINSKGEVVIQPQYAFLGELSKPVIIAKRLMCFGALDFEGNIIEPFRYEKISNKDGNIIIYNSEKDRYII